MRWWPRSIRWQMFLGLVLLEVLSIALFAFFLAHIQEQDVRDHITSRLAHQAISLAVQAEEGMNLNHPEQVSLAVRLMGEAPSVLRARITDPVGNVIYMGSNEPGGWTLEPLERAQLPHLQGTAARVFLFGSHRFEAVRAIHVNGQLRGYAWVESNPQWDTEQLGGMLRGILVFAGVWILASVLLVALVARGISRPLVILHRGTTALMAAPESNTSFPLPVIADNELGDLINAFNSMVASIQEQRAGLSDTLSILDSMLANAPVGLAFFDRHFRFVRVNDYFAGLTEIPLSRHLGRTPSELLPPQVAEILEEALESVFETDVPAREVELSGISVNSNEPWTWLVSVYPVRTTGTHIRWAGVIVRDVTERARAEEALRRTEKLAATGRLAASIAHEINNPLEAITNLLFLLRNFSGLAQPALQYVTMAEHEARRISEIAQQTLRFYRQSTLPLRANLAEVIDSVLDLYRGRLNTLSIQVERQYDPETSLFCFEGEIRQVIANLVGNAVDATPDGGRLIVRARASRDWMDPNSRGIRLTVADTGSGMTPDVRQRIFEAFFTTKDATGTGLGLWVSQEIIAKHRGRVRVRSRVAGPDGGPSGTIFQLFLPDDEALLVAVRVAASEHQLQ